MKTFSIQEALLAGWTGFKGRGVFLVAIILTVGILTGAPQWGIQQIQTNWLAISLALVVLAFEYFLYAGVIKIMLAVTDGKETRFGDLFSCGDVFIPYFLGAILNGLLIMLGIMLLVVPGLIAMVMFLFYGLFIIDKKVGPVEALKASAALTKGVRWKLFGFTLVLALINIVGALLFLVGLLVSIPVSWIALAYVYRKLLPQTQFV